VSEIKDGGPAFGHAASNGHCCGMSLRYWFAGQALMGTLSYPGGMAPPGEYAAWAYQYADAMLKAREVKP